MECTRISIAERKQRERCKNAYLVYGCATVGSLLWCALTLAFPAFLQRASLAALLIATLGFASVCAVLVRRGLIAGFGETRRFFGLTGACFARLVALWALLAAMLIGAVLFI